MKAIYDIIRKDDRIFFNDGEKYVLFDTGFVGNPFGKNSVSVNGKIGEIAVNTMPQEFFDSFINLKMDDGRTVDAVFNPMDGFNCWLQCGLLTICDEETEYDDSVEYFFEFADARLPIINGSINGQNCRFFFDSGARMTMFGERSLASEKLRTYREWMALKKKYADLEVFELDLAFPNGFKFAGEGALVEDPTYTMAAKMMNIRAMLGIDIFNFYDIAIITKGEKRGIGLYKRCGDGMMRIQEKMERIQIENDYEGKRLNKTDLLGEHTNIYLDFDGYFWSAKLGTDGSDTAHFCWVEDGELKYDNTYWSDYETPEEALTALERQCDEMKKRNVVLVSYDQLMGEGYAEDEDE